MKYIKIAVPVFLLLIMLLISGRYFMFLSFMELQKTAVKKAAISSPSATTKTYITANDLYKNTNGFEWKDNYSEVIINSMFFEVVKIIPVNSGYELILKSDTKETALYESYFEVEDEDEKEKKSSVFQLLLQVLFITTHTENNYLQIFKTIIHPKHILKIKLNDHLHRLIKPPSFS